MAEFPPGKVIYYRPARKKPRVYTERDVGRVVAYARNDGADDVLLIAYIVQSFGVRTLQCTLFKILDILNTGFFLGAIITTLNGIIVFLKGLKLIRTLKSATIPGIVELLIPKKWLGSLGAFYLYIGAGSAIAGGAVVFFTALSNNVALYLLMKGVCDAEISPLKVDVSELDLGGLTSKLDEVAAIFNDARTELEQ